MRKHFLLRIVLFLTVAILQTFFSSLTHAATPTKVTIHVPSKSLSIMPYYFGKDKGFFSPELVEPQLVVMSPPTAIAALVAGELDFSSTLGAATSAMMRGLPLKRVFYVQQDPSHVLIAQREIKTVQELTGKVIAVSHIHH
jgi:ABC-type nitrate/sulfonate/bicarbonate transport system substrate-binding protein